MRPQTTLQLEHCLHFSITRCDMFTFEQSWIRISRYLFCLSDSAAMPSQSLAMERRIPMSLMRSNIFSGDQSRRRRIWCLARGCLTRLLHPDTKPSRNIFSNMVAPNAAPKIYARAGEIICGVKMTRHCRRQHYGSSFEGGHTAISSVSPGISYLCAISNKSCTLSGCRIAQIGRGRTFCDLEFWMMIHPCE